MTLNSKGNTKPSANGNGSPRFERRDGIGLNQPIQSERPGYKPNGNGNGNGGQ